VILSDDFSLHDDVLDTAVTFGAVAPASTTAPDDGTGAA
jgi:hypothetical protein